MNTRRPAQAGNTCLLVMALFLVGLFLSASLQAEALGTGFTYQGNLNQAGQVANGSFDFRFELFDVEAEGVAVAAAVELGAVPVNQGIFSVELDFGSEPFAPVQQLWLQVSVRGAGGAEPHVPLKPRQKLTASPYAIAAANPPNPQSPPEILPVASSIPIATCTTTTPASYSTLCATA